MGARSGHSLLDRSAILIWGQDSVIQFVPSNNRPRICTERGKSPSSIAIQTVPGWEGESGHVSWSLFLVYVLRNHFHCVERKSGHGLEKVMKNFKVTFRAGEIAWLENACLLCKHQDPSSIPTLRKQPGLMVGVCSRPCLQNRVDWSWGSWAEVDLCLPTPYICIHTWIST